MSEEKDIHWPSRRASATFDEVRDLLGIDRGWRLWLREADHPGNNENADGQCELETRYLKATITIRRGLSAEREREVLLHELMHVALAPLDLANDRILELVPEAFREHATELYVDAEEQVIERVTRALQRVKPKPETPDEQ